MPVPIYLDVHVPMAVAHQLRRRGVDVIHAIEDARAPRLTSYVEASIHVEVHAGVVEGWSGVSSSFAEAVQPSESEEDV